MANYKDPDISKVSLMAALYNCMEVAQRAMRRVSELEKRTGYGPGGDVTAGWAPVLIDADGDATLKKPEHLECDLVLGAVGGCNVVDSVVIPEPEEQEE